MDLDRLRRERGEMKWIKNPKWTWRSDLKYWLFYYPIEFIRMLHAVAQKDHVLNDMGWREELDCAGAFADMKAGRFWTGEPQ